jgi:hypothetical protein
MSATVDLVQRPQRAAGWPILVSLIALSLVPVVAGTRRLVLLAGGPPSSPWTTGSRASRHRSPRTSWARRSPRNACFSARCMSRARETRVAAPEAENARPDGIVPSRRWTSRCSRTGGGAGTSPTAVGNSRDGFEPEDLPRHGVDTAGRPAGPELLQVDGGRRDVRGLVTFADETSMGGCDPPLLTGRALSTLRGPDIGDVIAPGDTRGHRTSPLGTGVRSIRSLSLQREDIRRRHRHPDGLTSTASWCSQTTEIRMLGARAIHRLSQEIYSGVNTDMARRRAVVL